MKKTNKKHWLAEIVNGVPEGMRHGTAIRLVGWLYYMGATSGNVWNVLNEWNQLNNPPLGKPELISIFQSTKKWELPWVGGEKCLD